MSQTQQFTPDLVYNLIANNPQGRAFVEQLARVNELQQAAKQFAPSIQNFVQNPMQGMQQIGDWAQGAVNQMPPQQNQQQAGTTQQEGGIPMNNPGGMMGMAMDYVRKFENSFKEITDSIATVNETNVALADKVSALLKDNETLIKDNQTLISEISAIREDIAKLL